MKLHELKYAPGSKKKRKIVGRGRATGHGKTSTRGQDGQNSRSGGGVRLGFEGGQLPLFKRLPKRGFNNVNRKEYTIVNVSTLNDRFAKSKDEITPELLLTMGVISKLNDGVKILGYGKLEAKLSIKAHKFSKSAIKAIEDAGGKYEVL